MSSRERRLVTRSAASISPKPHGGDHGCRWGSWRFDPGVGVLITDAGGSDYDIDIETCTTAAEVLDWIMQINGKTWADTSVMGDLVEAFDALLHPQATLCSCGHATRLDDPLAYAVRAAAAE